jgi:hypothetical protein
LLKYGKSKATYFKGLSLHRTSGVVCTNPSPVLFRPDSNTQNHSALNFISLLRSDPNVRQTGKSK